MNLTETDIQILSLLALIKVGKIKTEPGDDQEIQHMVEQLSPLGREIFDALEGKPSSNKAKQMSEELLEWASTAEV